MITGHIEVGCPECGMDLECDFSDYADPWNESPKYTAQCPCGFSMDFWIQAEEPKKAETEEVKDNE